MKNNPQTENELTFELEEEYELAMDSHEEVITLLVKHDYYSSDNDHGHMLLSSMVNTIKQTKSNIQVLFVDSGVKTLSEQHPVFEAIQDLSDSKEVILYACRESVAQYNVLASLSVELIGSSVIFDIILNSRNLIIIE